VRGAIDFSFVEALWWSRSRPTAKRTKEWRREIEK
jgi:hypothetical protein